MLYSEYSDVQMQANRRRELEEAIEEMLERAAQNAPSDTTMLARLKEVTREFDDQFRMELGHDPPAHVTPLRIEVDESAIKGCTHSVRGDFRHYNRGF